MGDPFRKAISGQPVRIPAQTWNAMLEAAQAHRDRQEHLGREARPRGAGGIVLVKNATGSDVGRFSVLGIDGVLIAPGDNEAEFLGRTAVTGVTPTTDHAGRFVVLIEPVKAGALGRAMLHGVTRARLYVEEDRTVGFAAPTAGETGYLVPYAGADGPVLAVTPNLPAPNVLAGAGIWTEEVDVEGVAHTKIHFDPVVPGGGLAWDPAGPGDTSRPFVLTDAARGMARDNDGIFPDLAPKGGLTLSSNPGDADRDLMAKVDGQKALYIDQSAANAGIQVILASDSCSHGPDWLNGSALKYATSDIGGVLGLALDVAQYGGLKMSPLEVYADGNWGVTKDGETGELKVVGDADGSESGSGVGLNGRGEVALKDPYGGVHRAVVSCAGMYLDRTGRVMGWYYWDGFQDVWTSPWGYPEPS